MKTTALFVAMATALLGGTSFYGCQTPTQKVEAAKENVQDAKENLNEEQLDANAEAQKVANEDEWKLFKSETEAQIKANDVRIRELKDKMKTSGKALDNMYANRIDALDLKNKELKTRLDNYEKDQTNWDTFKREFNHDMNELGLALKDLTVDNKN